MCKKSVRDDEELVRGRTLSSRSGERPWHDERVSSDLAERRGVRSREDIIRCYDHLPRQMQRVDFRLMRSAMHRLAKTGVKLSQHRHTLAFVFLALVICGIYLPVLTGARSLITNSYVHTGPYFVGDPLAGGPITLPLERLASLSWSHLDLPVVDPFQGYGIPLLANQGVPVYFPQLIVHALFPGNYSIWIVLNLIAIAFGSYLLASSFGQSLPGAIAVAMTASLAGVAPPNLNMGMLNPFAVLPFALLSIRYTLDPESSFRKCGLLGTVTSVAMLSLSGFQEVLPLMAFVIIVYAVGLIHHFRTLRRRAGLIVSTAISGGIGMVVGSVGLIPSFVAVRSGAGINPPGSYAAHAPLFWLSTLTIPSLTQRAMVDSPQDLGQTVWTLGSPILLLVLVLSVALVLHHSGEGGAMVCVAEFGPCHLWNSRLRRRPPRPPDI